MVAGNAASQPAASLILSGEPGIKPWPIFNVNRMTLKIVILMGPLVQDGFIGSVYIYASLHRKTMHPLHFEFALSPYCSILERLALKDGTRYIGYSTILHVAKPC